MNTKCKLTQQQEAQIYCIKHGHAQYFDSCFGYVHCGRCNDQIGDQLAGIFDTTNMIKIKHNCKKCKSLKKNLDPLDREILKRLESDKETFHDYEKILSGLSFGVEGMIDIKKIIKQKECPHFEYTYVNDDVLTCNNCGKIMIRWSGED